jgi:uncharacterized membrane protein required for colicin V production
VTGFGWPDAVIGLIVAFGTVLGYRRGFVKEVIGFVALAAGLGSMAFYPGMWDGFFATAAHAPHVVAHVIGLLAFGALAYLVVLALGIPLAAVAKLPLVGIANRLCGALVGFVKSAAFAWALLYAATFFPLSPAVRDDLRRSPLAQALLMPFGEERLQPKAIVG